MTILELKNICKSYKDQMAVDDLSFSVRAGEIVGFLGPNGAGKSTTMKMVCGILSPDRGQILLNGLSPDQIEYRKNISYLSELNPLYSELYIQEALVLEAGIHQVSDKQNKIKDVLQVCGLISDRNKQIKTLSKGFRQRVGLAIAILHHPSLYVLDEATTGLDPNQIIDIRELIKSLGKKSAVLISTHILQEVESICQRCILIHKGKMIADDSMEALKQQASGVPTVRLKLASSLSVTSLTTIWPDVQLLPDGAYLISSKDPHLSRSIFRWAVEKKLEVTELTPISRSMEEVFQSLTIDSTESR
jgi:ABC-2 type transport system ATP-binding protein